MLCQPVESLSRFAIPDSAPAHELVHGPTAGGVTMDCDFCDAALVEVEKAKASVRRRAIGDGKATDKDGHVYWRSVKVEDVRD